MLKQEKKILDFLHFKRTDVCTVCTPNVNNHELFLKFHPDDLEKDSQI